jgi:2-polyprenyl-3-methyl-5-hydroxy-6-metoxy-1,4-benzoquinol methylase
MSLAHKISGKNRLKKYQCFMNEIQPTEKQSILDVGFSDHEHSPNDNFLEKHYPHPENITALGIDTPVEFATRYPKVKAVKYNGQEFPFADKQFDIVWSNAVIEHVGDFPKQVFFLREMLRVGRVVYFTTPNRHFPIEVHSRLPLAHWLPKRHFEKIARLVGKGWATGDYMFLLTSNRLKEIITAANAAECRIIRNRILLCTMDFAVIARR